MDEWGKVIAQALRMMGTQDPTAAKAVGGQGAAGRVDANARDEYLRYAEQEMANGGEPLPYARWFMQRNPTASPVPRMGG